MIAFLVLAFVGREPPIASSTPTMARQNVCGQLALAAAAQLAGSTVTPEQVFEILPANNEPKTLLELQDAAEKLGLKVRAFYWPVTSPPPMPCPCIVQRPIPGIEGQTTPEIGHFVVLANGTWRHVLLLDLPHAPVWVPFEAVAQTWNGVALFVATDEAALPAVLVRWQHGIVGRGILALLSLMLGLAGLGFLISLIVKHEPNRRLTSSLASAFVGRTAYAWGIATLTCFLVAAWMDGWGRPLDLHPSLGEETVTCATPTQTREVTASELAKGNGNVMLYFDFWNHGGVPIEIQDVKVSCSCAEPTVSPRVIAPGTFARLRVALRLDNYPQRSAKIFVAFKKAVPGMLILNAHAARRN